MRQCLDDADFRVAGAAREALALLQLSQEAECLLAAVLAERDASRRWVLLDSLLVIADPGDKHRPCPDWAHRVAETLPYLVRVYIGEKLEKRREQVAKEAEDRDR